MEYEWDERKRQSNIDKHGIDFIDAKEIWQTGVVEIPSPQSQHGEQRHIALGLMEGRVIAVVYTWRTRNKRIISARKAREYEQKIYRNAFGSRA